MKTANDLRNSMLAAFIFLLATLLFSLSIFIFDFLKPLSDTSGVWFQRSGSLIVAASIWSEFTLVRMDGYVDPYNEKYMVVTDMPRYLSSCHRLFSKMAMACVLLGTVIWGYGDRFY